ncbi:uncharacterized protein LOC118506330 isoform X2 [Anopheles stephensi]|uniref:uncharacterized protein LOC118506330 isoform X2 n=1 Tax=Anopheles stephensi TaxID=30069 RepID=UPI0016588687|nr:uncharacterized protein LOC118506330 isoform X2 [Anopheles stephensi]
MKPKKQQPSAANEKKPSGSGAATGSSGNVSDSTVGAESKSTPNTSSSSSTTAPAKKPVKRLQSKTKESVSSSSSGSAVPNTNTLATTAAGGKSTEKIFSSVQQSANQQQSTSSKSKPSPVNAAKSPDTPALANTSKILPTGTGSVESSKDGTTKAMVTESVTNTSTSSCSTTGTAVGKPETSVNSSGKGNKHVVKPIKSDSASQSALQNSAKGSVKDTPDRSRKPTKETGSASKKSTGSAEKTDAGKRKQQSGSNPASGCGVAGSGDGRAGPAGPSITSASIDSKLREKEKKIQKELKNLGVPDKTINQSIDAAYLLESAVESVVNPSISEMVKTKSRTTVAQGKYGGGGGGESIIGSGVMARKSSITSEEGGVEGETEKPSKESASGSAGKIKKSVTLKLDRQPGEGSKKMSGKGTALKEAGEKLTSKGGRKDDKAMAGTSGGVNAAGAKTLSGKASGQGAKSNKKANNASGSSEPKQKKSGVAELAPKGMEQQQMDVASELPVVKQLSEQEGTMGIGRGSSIEQEDHEEKNEEVHIRIDSIVKALEREDIETPSGTKKESDAETRKEELADGAIVVTPPAVSSDGKATNDGKTKKQPAPRKPPAKKDGPTATAKTKAKEANEKKKANAVDQANKKEVKFQEQTPASPAKRKYVKKPKAGGTAEDAATGEKPAKMAKSAAAKKASVATSKVKQTNAKPNSKTQTTPSADASGGTTLTDASKDDKAVDASEGSAKAQAAGTITTVPTRDRSSTENDDDVPLRQLQQKQTAVQPVTDSATGPSKDKPTTTGQSSAQEETVKSAQDETAEKEKGDRTEIGPELSAPSSAAGPILAGLLKSTGKQGKRPYVRKNATSGGSGKNSKAVATSSSCPIPTTLSEECPSKERKLEKKDVYDFDDSESEVETPVKPGKPSFKRKSSMDISQSREDISRDAVEDSQSFKLTVDDGKKEETPAVATDAADGGVVKEKCNDEDETAKRTVPLKKQKRRIEAALSESAALSKKEQKSGESSESEEEQNDAADPDAPEMKTKKKVSAIGKKVKQETKEDSHSSADEADDDEEPGVGDGDEDENKDSADSDGCSSTDTVRTRVAKKRQSAKKRNVKLYGFWSGPKRHRVASLNALAKVHCLYENEMRGALESSLMSQSSGSRVIRTITKDGERIKKERICPEEESAGEESRSGETMCGESAEPGTSNEPEQSKSKELERKESDKKREEKKECLKQERKEAPSQQHKQTESVAREEPKPKVKEEAPKKDSDQDSAESSEEEPVVMRNLRCAPGLRGAGKHWDPDASSLESEIEQLPDSDETYAQGKDTDPTRKRKVKKKVVRKSKAKSAAVQAKTEKADKDKEKVSEKTEKPPKPPVKKIKKELKALMTDNERQDDGTVSSSSTGSEKAGSAKAKPEEGVKKRKREPKCEKTDTGGDYKDYIGKKRMASLNATAMLAATYEVQRVLYRNTDSSDSECSAEKVPKTKKGAKDAKEQKETASKESTASANKSDGKEKKDTTGENELRDSHAAGTPLDNKHPSLSTSAESTSSNQPAALIAPGSITVAQHETLTKKKKMVIKTEPMRDRKDDPMEVKREIEEPRPVSSNLVIAQDTEVTITGVYVNSTLGANQEAYCKMQYRVQQSVTEERLVRPGEAPPKSYTPLSALSSMRPPNDQTLSTPPLFVPPAQCDSPLGPPRAFYPPPTSSSGSSSAFCAPMPHDSPGYYQPAGPLISPHLLGQPPSQHGPKSGPDGDTLLQSPQQPPASSTADSTDSDVLLTGGGVDLGHRSQPFGSSRYGAATAGGGGGGPPGNLYPRPMQMHCPPAYLSPGYYAPSPYGPQPPPPHGPPPEMYYTHAYPAHFYPKFAPPYYPTSRRYYAGPGPGPEHHLYEQAPPPSSAQGPPGPPPPPSGAQLVPAGPQGPQHLDHYPYPPYPGYGSPGPGSGGQCYPRNLQHPPPPPAYMDAHYTTNCPCPMQCPKNVNAGSLIGIKASKGPVATNNHIVQNQPTTRISTTEPITISSSSSSASSSSSPPAPVDSPVTSSATTTSVRQTLPDTESSSGVASKQQQQQQQQQQPHPSHGAYHAHHHHGSTLAMEMHPPGVPTHHHPHTYPYHFHHHHPSPLHHSQQHGSMQPEIAEKTAITATSTSAPITTLSSSAKQTPPVVTTAATGSDPLDKMCYKTELPIKPESVTDMLSTPMHYGSPYHHPYHHPLGYYHHPKLTDLKEESHGALTPPYSISGKMALLETPEMSPVRVSTVLNVPPVHPGEALQPSLKGTECGEKAHCTEDKLTSIPVSTTIVKQEIEEFKLLEPLVGTVCKKEDFEETGPAMTPDLMDESIVIKKDRDEEKPIKRSECHLEHQPAAHPHASVDHHHLHHHLQQMRVATHLPHHLHHHSASTNLLHGSPHHHHLHSHYSVQQQQQQQQQQQPPLITGLLVEKDDLESDAKLPPDSKSMLTELVLTTEASMVEAPKSTLTTTSKTETLTPTTARSAVDVPAKMDVANSVCKSPSQQPRGTSSDNSFSLSDSLLTPRVAGAPEPLSSISKNGVKVQSHDSCSAAGSPDPPSPVPIPASTVKRRPLLVACKKATPKQSPPNSYKNLIKRTNGLEGDDDALLPQCPEPVELSEDEEEEEEEDEEEDEEEEDDDEEENEEEDEEDEEEEEDALLRDGKVEDVEDIELQEQRKVEIAKGKTRRLAIPRSRPPPSAKKRLAQRKPSTTTTDSRRKGCRRNILRTTGTTPPNKLQRRQFALECSKLTEPRVAVVGTERARSGGRRYYRVFRSSIDSLKRLPIAVRKRLLRRSNVTLLPKRQSALRDKRACRSEQSETLNEVKESQPSPVAASESVTDSILEDRTLPNKGAQDARNEAVSKEDQRTASTAVDVGATVLPPLSNVDRTIDLVAKGYFSEPEILSGTELQVHSRAWLKKLKQQQEGRSHSEQSRGAKCAGNTNKCKSKDSPLVLDTPNSSSPMDLSFAGTKGSKKPKAKSKASKQQPTPVVVQVQSTSKPEQPAECKESKSKKKTSSKERKKDAPASRKRKQKELSQAGDGDDSHARKRSNHVSVMAKEDESLYQRATSTPIPAPGADPVSPAAGQDDRDEEDRRKGGVAFDDSVVTLMDHSSVIDDRETDFDDAATMLVEDDVASVDTNVLVNQHNNNNNSAVTDKNNMIQEQERNAADPIVRDEPIQAIIAEGKEGSELEPPEGMEPFMDEQLEEEEAEEEAKRVVSTHLPETLQPQPSPPVELPVDPALALRQSYEDDAYEELEDEEELLPKRGSSRSVKRRRSRSKTKAKKFSMKKRHRPSTNRNLTAAELEELIVPKKCNSIPRWSNGWTWEGQPFQGMVFLNSDDPPVLRTCYPAMRHSVGDIIKPRDCVLLKAGSKRAELPYVAKVAHLWENPDDGEMMMSLLWYYRPEHTEQGRQRTDGPDEVFASRHKDHNSVACIEDKCYVLTFSEYCRFRRQLKGYEENIEEQPSIVPALRRENPRLPPPIVSPELVMYCQRVYEFRQKRLLKCTS